MKMVTGMEMAATPATRPGISNTTTMMTEIMAMRSSVMKFNTDSPTT